jgi:hypothetical protein
MKTGCFGMKLYIGVGALWLAGFTAWGQMPSDGAPGGMSGALTRLFGDIKAFSAKADVQVQDTNQEQIADMAMDFAFLEGKIRVEMDLTQMKNRNMPPGMAAALKQMGMAHVISIVRPDKQRAYAVYPDQKAVLTMPLPEEGADPTNTTSKLKKTALGKETAEGHPCVKNKVLVTDNDGKTVEALTWNATDLKDFPVKIETTDKENTSVVRFQQINFARPEPNLFDPPPAYTVYDDPMAFQQAMKKNLGDPVPPK